MTKIERVKEEDGTISTIVEPEDPGRRLIVDGAVQAPITFKVVKPTLGDGKQWDQTHDAAKNIRYSVSLGLPQLKKRIRPRLGRAVVVGGAPSIKDHLETIRKLSEDKDNAIFAINWTHTWLIENGITPRGTVFFEIDAEPDTVLKALSPDVTYFICSHCDKRTFDATAGFKRVLWHGPPNSDPEKEAHEELKDKITGDLVGGGISTFTRTLSVALFMGFRHFDVFGCDSSFPETAGTHVEGYQTIMDSETDGMIVYAQSPTTGKTRKFKTLGYLAYQQEEFKSYCNANHAAFSMRVYGDSLLRFTHEDMFPEQYDQDTYHG